MATRRYQQIILHAGLHKTGTTSIQDNCHRLRGWLKDHGIIYPAFKYHDRQFANHSDPVIAAICKPTRMYGMDIRVTDVRSDGNNDAHEAIRVFSEQFQHLLEQPEAGTLLLSAEMVCAFDDEDILALRHYLEKYTERLQVVAFVRSPQSSIESIVAQRGIGGKLAAPNPRDRTVKRRYKRLQRNFSDALQVVNYHEAVEHQNGLVGYFFRHLGLPEEEVNRLEFSRANARVSMEAYTLVRAINLAHPAGADDDHGVTRQRNDLESLYSLPGALFRIENFEDSELYVAVNDDGEWLEKQLGFQFPKKPPRVSAPLWQVQTLVKLEAAINRLENRVLRQACANALNEEADSLRDSDSGTAAVLAFISQRIQAVNDPPIELILQKIGADYFKFSALQVEREAPRMALLLMSLALELRPDGGTIIERIQHYRNQLGE